MRYASPGVSEVNKENGGLITVIDAILPSKFSKILLFLWRTAAAPFVGWFGYFRGELLYRRNRSPAAESGGQGEGEGEGEGEGANPLSTYFDANVEGPGIWKWRHYFDVYHRHFQKYVGKEVHIVEIGVFSGGSLNMWREYFGSDCHIYGIDIEESCRSYEREGVEIHVGDQADRSFWEQFRREVPRVDIVIDDGGHTVRQQRTTLENYCRICTPAVYMFARMFRVHTIASTAMSMA